MESTGKPEAKRVKFGIDGAGDGLGSPEEDNIDGLEGTELSGELERQIFSCDSDKENDFDEAQSANLRSLAENDMLAADILSKVAKSGKCEFTGKQQKDLREGSLVDEAEDSSNTRCPSESEVCPSLKESGKKKLQHASALSSAVDSEVIHVAYDDEDLNEDAQRWLEGHYDKSNAAAKNGAAVVQTGSNNEHSAADREAVGDIRTKKRDQTAGHSESKRRFYEKTVLVEKVKRFKSFNILPDGWVAVTHDSGMPIYLHKELRVCTLSMPYFLGPGSVRRHDIPLSAVPCLEYRRAKSDPEASATKSPGVSGYVDNDSSTRPQASATNSSASRQVAANVGGLPSVQGAAGHSLTLPHAKAHVETAGEMILSTSLSAEELHDYCNGLFEFKKINIEMFPSWKERRDNSRERLPQMSDNTALIVCSAEDLPDGLTSGGAKKGNLVLSPKGKTFVCILHEYLQWRQKTKPTYVYRENDNPANPFSAVVKINGMEYGTGSGASKKKAKSDAARKTLAVFLSPGDMQTIEAQANSENMKPLQDNADVVFFDSIKVDDKRMTDLCKRAGLPSPYSVLLECLQRNFMMGDTDVKMQINVIATAKVEVTLTVSQYSAQVIAKNKKLGKQEASQKLLQQLHPNITCWGSILRLYGDGSIGSTSQRKQEQKSITQLHGKKSSTEPNYQVLDKLKSHMLEVHQQRQAGWRGVSAKGSKPAP